jgi:hypothetical protein
VDATALRDGMLCADRKENLARRRGLLGTGVTKPEPMHEAVSQRSSFRFRSAATILRIR